MVWLELNRIRHLPPEQRQPLKDTSAVQWQHTLTSYLSQLFPSPTQATVVHSTSPLVVTDALLRYTRSARGPVLATEVAVVAPSADAGRLVALVEWIVVSLVTADDGWEA